MLPDVWLGHARIKKLRKSKFANQSTAAFINLANSLFQTYDLNRGQLAALIELLEAKTEWPKNKLTETYAPAANSNNRQHLLPDWVIDTLGLLLAVPSDISVLDLNCGAGSFVDFLPEQVFYEGHSLDINLLNKAKQRFPEYLFKCSDVSQMMNQEPDTSYSLVLFNTVQWEPATQAATCLELSYKKENLESLDIATELASKCAVKGGIAVVYSITKPSQELLDWLSSKGTILALIELCGEYLLLFRKGIKIKQADFAYYKFNSVDDLLTWASNSAILGRVPISSEDPRPLVLKNWEVNLETNTESNCLQAADVELYLSKSKVKMRFKNHWPALEWAQHQALTASTEESWNKTVKRFETRLALDTYLSLRDQDLNKLTNLPKNYTVLEEPALTKYLDKVKQRTERMSLSYPEKTTLDNRYYTLGIGSVLASNNKKYEVKFSEPDFSNSKPPKVHLERIE